MSTPSVYIRIRDCPLTQLVLDWAAMGCLRWFSREKEDVFLCSYPKSGRTWLRFMISCYQVKLNNLDIKLDLKNFTQLSPNMTFFSGMGFPRANTPSCVHRLLGTHSGFPHLFRNRRVMILTRDIRDILVSYYYHRTARNEYRGDLESYIWSSMGLAEVLAYKERWQKALSDFSEDDCLFVRYEALHADPGRELTECLRFLHLDIRESFIEETVEYSRAANMKKLEAREGTHDFSPEELVTNPAGCQVREARVRGFETELSPATVKQVGEILRKELYDTEGYDY